MEPSLSAGSSQRGASVKWTAKLIWPDGGGSAARARLAAQARQASRTATIILEPRDFVIDSPSPCPLPLRGRGMRDPLSLCEGEGRGEGADGRPCADSLSLCEGEGRGEGARSAHGRSLRHIEMAAREM